MRHPRRQALFTLALLPAFAGAACAQNPAEAGKLAGVLALNRQSVVADVGAGDGWMTVGLAKLAAQVYSTEIEQGKRAKIEARAAKEKLSNISVVEALPNTTNLPEACCDAIVMQRVYHHIEKRADFNASLRRSLKPGGLLAMVDFEPRGSRDGHGVKRAALTEDMEKAGFTKLREIEQWSGRSYLIVFRNPQ